MQLARTVLLLLLAAALPACSRFGVYDAASRIAFVRQCDPIELTVHEGHRGAYEAVGCDHVGLWRCAGSQCTPYEGASEQREIGPVTARALRAAASVEEAVLECTEQSPVTVQWLVRPSGRPGSTETSRPLEGETRLCVLRAVYHGFSVPEAAGILVSYAYGAASDEAVASPGSSGAPDLAASSAAP